jgi:pyridoxamine 5'-phosphate oxidase
VCFFATATAQGRPEVRAISLRDIDANGFSLLINEHSPKWQQYAAREQCALHLFWATVQRQYRVYGRLEPMPLERLQQYWNRKGHPSRLLEHYYESFEAQSQPIASRDVLLQGIATLQQHYPRAEMTPLADSLRGVYLYPTGIDVWHGSPEDRLHDRREFTRTDTGWSSRLLVP